METAVTPGVSGIEVLVHHFAWCSCRNEVYTTDHMKLKPFKGPLESAQAAALSYGIGDFKREVFLLGHIDGRADALVQLEFGIEWEIKGLMTALVALSEKHGALWLDRLSIPQDEESIRLHLQEMPRIYHRFEVVVLLPDAPCPCLADAFRAWITRGSWAWTDGDFNITAVASTCLNAFPVSSYHFRLWTKLEFSFAAAISIHYCGPPGGQCSLGNFEWLYRTTVIPTRSEGHLSRWAEGKYTKCSEASQNQGDYAEEMAWSKFRDAHIKGRDHLHDAVAHFYQDVDMDAFFATLTHTYAQLTKFILGDRLQRIKDEHETIFVPDRFKSEHKASDTKDFAAAVLPTLAAYTLPPNYKSMDVPALVQDGIEQYETVNGAMLTRLPKGLFEFGTGSMRCKPTIHLREDDIKCVGDVYGSLHAALFRTFVMRDMTVLRLRDAAQSCASRIPESMAYLEVFSSDSPTADVCEFMRRVVKVRSGIFGRSRVQAYKAWASAMIRDKNTVTVDRWPSPKHEQAIFEEAIRYDWPWGSWPEINHETVCYELMCNYVCIHPDVARAKGLQLVVKLSDPPCIGFVNGVIFHNSKSIEQYRRDVGAPAPKSWKGERTIFPKDWLTILANTGPDLTAQSAVMTLEALKVDSHFSVAKYVKTDEPRLNRTVPMYHVVGVWFSCLQSDPSIGAELIKDPEEAYGAVLI